VDIGLVVLSILQFFVALIIALYGCQRIGVMMETVEMLRLQNYYSSTSKLPKFYTTNPTVVGGVGHQNQKLIGYNGYQLGGNGNNQHSCLWENNGKIGDLTRYEMNG